MKSTLDQIEDIKYNGYNLDFSAVFNLAFENYKKIALYAGLILLVFSILAFFLGGGLFISLYGVEHFNAEYLKNLEKKGLTETTLLIYTLVITVVSALLSPFTAGFLKMAYNADHDEEFHVSTIFSYYASKHFLPLFLSTLLISLAGGAISVGFNMLGITIIDSVLTLLIALFTSLTMPLIIFGNLKTLEAINASVILVSKQPFVLILLFLVTGLASMVGFIGCCIGIVFTIPITYSIKYAIYSSILTIEEDENVNHNNQTVI